MKKFHKAKSEKNAFVRAHRVKHIFRYTDLVLTKLIEITRKENGLNIKTFPLKYAQHSKIQNYSNI